MNIVDVSVNLNTYMKEHNLNDPVTVIISKDDWIRFSWYVSKELNYVNMYPLDNLNMNLFECHGIYYRCEE